MEEEKLNLAEILKDAPKGTKLYSPICGECELGEIDGKYIEVFPTFRAWRGKEPELFAHDGRSDDYYKDAECLLFPSKDQRDWSKFVTPIKKGQWYMCIKDLTMEDGQCLYHEGLVYLSEEDGCITDDKKWICHGISSEYQIRHFRPAAQDEIPKQKERVILHPGDRVLVRNENFRAWSFNIFSHLREGDEFPYACIEGTGWERCIPYNSDTRHLVGTTDPCPIHYEIKFEK